MRDKFEKRSLGNGVLFFAFWFKTLSHYVTQAVRKTESSKRFFCLSPPSRRDYRSRPPYLTQVIFLINVVVF